MKKQLSALLLLMIPNIVSAQIDTVLLTTSAAHLFPSFPVKSSFGSLFDRNNPFLYSANMEYGLGIYDISVPGAITPLLNYSISNFNNLDVAAIAQRNTSLFVGLGDHNVNNNAATGLAIIDISNPAAPFIKDIWDSAAFTHGVSDVLIDGNYAYLSTMTDGIIILDISNENNIFFVSNMQPDLAFPAPSSNAHNARGMKIRNDTLYLCFDRGGLRVLDVVNKGNPQEIYKYINTTLNNSAAAAYNDLALKGNYAFISVDYCGLEIVDIADTPFTAIQWFNPWGCNFTNWSGAALHTNKLKLANNDSILFVSAGQTEVLVFDVSDALNTILAGQMANLSDSLATYALDVYDNKVSLSFIHTPFHIPPFTPFYADPGGLKLLEYNVVLQSTGMLANHPAGISISPNPSSGLFAVQTAEKINQIVLYDSGGREIYRNEPVNDKVVNLNFELIGSGLYFLTVITSGSSSVSKLIIQK